MLLFSRPIREMGLGFYSANGNTPLSVVPFQFGFKAAREGEKKGKIERNLRVCTLTRDQIQLLMQKSRLLDVNESFVKHFCEGMQKNTTITKYRQA